MDKRKDRYKMINRPQFFTSIRPLFKRLSQSQVDGLNFLLDAFEQDGNLSAQEMAYMLATAYHETAATMLPIEEYGKGRGRKYGQNIDIDGSRYKGLPHIYYGRGYVQLTWLTNYKRAGDKICVDLVNHPELALNPTYAAQIMIAGMREGWFTGKKLSDYISAKADYVGARRIINGTDKAQLIAGYAKQFESALK